MFFRQLLSEETAGYVAGGLLAGLTADALGYSGAIAIVAALTALSGIWVAFDFPGRGELRRGPPVSSLAGARRPN